MTIFLELSDSEQALLDELLASAIECRKQEAVAAPEPPPYSGERLRGLQVQGELVGLGIIRGRLERTRRAVVSVDELAPAMERALTAELGRLEPHGADSLSRLTALALLQSFVRLRSLAGPEPPGSSTGS